MNRLDKGGWLTIIVQVIGFALVVIGRDQRGWVLAFGPIAIWLGLFVFTCFYTIFTDSDKLIEWLEK